MDIQTNPMPVTSDVLPFAFPELTEPSAGDGALTEVDEPEVMTDDTTGAILDVSV